MADTQNTLNTARLAFHDNKPMAFLRQTVGQPATSGTIVQITFGGATGDTWSAWSAGSPSLYTVKVAGLYAVSGMVIWNANATNARDGFVYYNGVAVVGSQVEYPGSSVSVGSVPVPRILQQAVVGDTFQLASSQNSGGSLSTLVTGSVASTMTVEWIRS